MMNGDECREKAEFARERAASATDHQEKVRCTELVHDWLKLGRLADAHAGLEAALLAKDPD